MTLPLLLAFAFFIVGGAVGFRFGFMHGSVR